MSEKIYDISVIGAGIIGLSTAMQLSQKFPNKKICLIEKENDVAKHQTGHNSGVIHSGIYYKPGSLKAKTCQDGIKLLTDFCNKYSIPYEITGKIIVANTSEEISQLSVLLERGKQNGIGDIRLLSKKEIKKIEPSVRAEEGLWVGTTGIIDYKRVADIYLTVFKENKGEVFLNTKFVTMERKNNSISLKTTRGNIKTRTLVNCSGLNSDRVAIACGLSPKFRIVPFRGDYYKINVRKQHVVNNLIYPVPNPEFPFLGVHFTRMINGEKEVGPNAVLSLKREGYSKYSFSLKDTIASLSYFAFWKMASRYWKIGLREMLMSFNKRIFVKEAKKMIPEIESKDLYPTTPGIRAQALDASGKLVDDFRVLETEDMVHVLNAPSPAATASLAIGKKIIEYLEDKL